MSLPDDHQRIEIESFESRAGSDPQGKVQLRPVKGQKFPSSLMIEGNKSLIEDYPVGTRFKAQVALMKRPTGGQYLFSSWQWDVHVISLPDAAA